jgi:hypothetical protein
LREQRRRTASLRSHTGFPVQRRRQVLIEI